MTTSEAELRSSIEALTVAVSIRAIPRVIHSLVDAHLTVPQLRALTATVVENGSTVGRLANTFGSSKATASKLVDKLEAQGLVTRQIDNVDSRVRRLQPTPRGREVVSAVLGARPELSADVLDGLTTEELRGLEIGLRAISRELQNRPTLPSASARVGGPVHSVGRAAQPSTAGSRVGAAPDK